MIVTMSCAAIRRLRRSVSPEVREALPDRHIGEPAFSRAFRARGHDRWRVHPGGQAGARRAMLRSIRPVARIMAAGSGQRLLLFQRSGVRDLTLLHRAGKACCISIWMPITVMASRLRSDDEPRVTTVSIHEENRWPYSGTQARSDAAPTTCRCRKASMTANSSIFWSDAWCCRWLKIQAVDGMVICCGADCLAGDPLSGMMLCNVALWQAVEQLIALGQPRLCSAVAVTIPGP